MDLLDALAQTFDHTIGVAVPVAADAGPTDQLVAFLGRRP